jgi:hypothetical protein
MAAVLFNIEVNTACYDSKLITEIGFGIYDPLKAKKREHSPSGREGSNNIELHMTSRHYVVRDTAGHHPGTCANPSHKAQPWDFTFKKSVLIDRAMIPTVLEKAYEIAACQSLTHETVKAGERRQVILIGAGEGHHHASIKATSWYREEKLTAQWDIRRHPPIRERFPKGVPSFRECLDAFGVVHRVNGLEVAHNAGNKATFHIHLHLALEQKEEIGNKQDIKVVNDHIGDLSPFFYMNRPPNSPRLLLGERAVYTQPSRPDHDTYTHVKYDGEDNVSGKAA